MARDYGLVRFWVNTRGGQAVERRVPLGPSRKNQARYRQASCNHRGVSTSNRRKNATMGRVHRQRAVRIFITD